MADGMIEQLKKTAAPLPKEWQKVLPSGTAQYEAAVLLNSQGKLPKLVIGKTAQESYNAQFSPEENTVTINPNTKNNDFPQAVAHELTHALNSIMNNQVFAWRDRYEKTGQQPTGADAKFLAAWRKLHPGDSKLPVFQYPRFGGEDYNDYRYSIGEKPAFAVGRMEDPRKSLTKEEYLMSSPGGSHVDATIATEQAILRDMYARTQAPQQAQVPWYQNALQKFGF